MINMGRSQLLKDVVSGKESLESILLRLKVILSDLNNEQIMNWVNGELQGYNSNEMVPAYRMVHGNAIGTFLVNYQFQYTNQAVPLESLLPADKIENIKKNYITESIGALQAVLEGENRDKYGFIVPTAYCHSISIDELQIASMTVRVPSNTLDGIISNIKAKLVDVIMELEKQFENLDELDISDQVEGSSKKKEEVVGTLQQIIFDRSINIGDKNKIGKSRLGHLFGGDKK
jgi:hypothetical protein